MTVTISIITSSTIEHDCVYHHDYVTIIMVTGTSLEYVGDSHHDYVRTYTSIVYV